MAVWFTSAELSKGVQMAKTTLARGRRSGTSKLKAAAYLRTSAEDQHASIENQRKRLLRCARKSGISMSWSYEEW
jgi:hypothetical protein